MEPFTKHHDHIIFFTTHFSLASPNCLSISHPELHLVLYITPLFDMGAWDLTPLVSVDLSLFALKSLFGVMLLAKLEIENLISFSVLKINMIHHKIGNPKLTLSNYETKIALLAGAPPQTIEMH